ncbi:glycosyltransferase family 39 protein, partial [bacterium]|nr:glycosyltransferase family 39 protein [bacterium]
APDSLVPPKLAVGIFGFLSIIVFYLLIKRFTPDLIAALLAVAVGIQLNMLLFSQRLISDIPYIFFSTLTLLLIVKRTQSTQSLLRLKIAIGIAISLG